MRLAIQYITLFLWLALATPSSQLGEEKQRAEERQHIQSISAYFESLLELTKGIERGEEEVRLGEN